MFVPAGMSNNISKRFSRYYYYHHKLLYNSPCTLSLFIFLSLYTCAQLALSWEWIYIIISPRTWIVILCNYTHCHHHPESLIQHISFRMYTTLTCSLVSRPFILKQLIFIHTYLHIHTYYITTLVVYCTYV